jgi:aquaporin Z
LPAAELGNGRVAASAIRPMPMAAQCAHAVPQAVSGGTIMRIYLAEAIGTFVLVFGGCGAAVLAGSHIGFTGVALAFGLSLLAMAYTIGPISGCHINPAVTFGLMLARKIAPHTAAGYVAAQILGAVLGAAVLLAVAHGTGSFDATGGFASNGYGARSPAATTSPRRSWPRWS